MADPGSAACIEADLAAGYAEHRLAPDEVARVEAHIDTCAACRELVSMLARLHYTQPASPASDQDAREIGGILPRGARVGPFEIDEPLDAGGMGLVYRAHDTRLDRRVAVKAVRDLRGDPAQLMQEARMMAQLAHPNVVPVHDVIEAHDQIFLAMELVVGRNVRQWLDDAPRRWTAIVDVFLAAGAGLAAAHAAGVVHGDVKPANILVGDDGRVRITDFGLASAGRMASAPPTTAARGTPAYMAPEQRAGVPCDAAGDQYAFSASIHEALFGSSPGRPPTKSPRVPRGLRRCLARGLAPLPVDRFPALSALLRELRATRSARRRWSMAGTVAALAIGGVAFGYGEHRVEHALCADAAPRLATPWTAEARLHVQREFALIKLPYAADALQRVEAALDEWSGELDHARTDVCEAGWFERGRAREKLAATLDCLATRVIEGHALISQLEEADAPAVQSSIAAVDGLVPVARCAEVLPPRVLAADSPSLQHIRELFTKAHALHDSSKVRAALPVAQEALDAAIALGDPGTEAEARVSMASAQGGVSNFDDAEKNLQAALLLAERAQDDRTRAQIWVNLIQIEFWRGHYAQVDFMKSAALGAADRVNDLFDRSEILMMVGGAISQLNRVPEAQGMFEEAVRLRRQVLRLHDRRLSAALSALGNAYAMQGQLDAGIAAHKEALTIAVSALGPVHPGIATLRGNLASDYTWALREPEAVAELEQCVAILTAADGDKGQKVAVALTDLGTAQLLAGQLAQAAASSARAEALWAEIGKDHPDRGDALLVRYQAAAALGKPADVADLETAVKLAAAMPPFMRARAQLALGQASTGARAVELVTAAATGFATSTLPLAQRELGVANAWLAEHRP